MTALLIYLLISGIAFPITLGFMISYIKKYKKATHYQNKDIYSVLCEKK